MKKKVEISLICIIIFLVLVMIVVALYKFWNDKNEYKDCETIKGVIVKTDNQYKSLWIMEINSEKVYRVGLKEENTEFKRDQEIQVYYNGMKEIYLPQELDNVNEIKIVKHKSDVQIPDDVIRECCNSSLKVEASIVELNDSGIRLDIQDSNELPYEYSHEYTLSKEVEEPVIYRYSEPNSTPIEYEGMSKVMKSMSKISDRSSAETEVILPDTNKESSMQVRKFDWTSLYGKLEPRGISV